MCASFFRFLAFCLLLSAGVSGCRRATSSDGVSGRPLRVAAASDLEPAFLELGRVFTARTGREVVFSFASSSVLAQQVGQGAPMDLFAAANRELVEQLERGGQIVQGSARPYARGRLVMWTRRGDALPAELPALREGRYQRISVANPEHAPYGQAAVAALRAGGLFDELRPRLVYGENVRQAHQYVATGNADVALGALSLAVAAGEKGHYTVVPDALYPPLVQVLGVIKSGDQAAAGRFAELVLSAAGQEILKKHGFLPPPGA